MNTQMNRQKQALATKQKIFSRAISLFARQSYENVTVQDICAEDCTLFLWVTFPQLREDLRVIERGGFG